MKEITCLPKGFIVRPHSLNIVAKTVHRGYNGTRVLIYFESPVHVFVESWLVQDSRMLSNSYSSTHN